MRHPSSFLRTGIQFPRSSTTRRCDPLGNTCRIPCAALTITRQHLSHSMRRHDYQEWVNSFLLKAKFQHKISCASQCFGILPSAGTGLSTHGSRVFYQHRRCGIQSTYSVRVNTRASFQRTCMAPSAATACRRNLAQL